MKFCFSIGPAGAVLLDFRRSLQKNKNSWRNSQILREQSLMHLDALFLGGVPGCMLRRRCFKSEKSTSACEAKLGVSSSSISKVRETDRGAKKERAAQQR